MTAWIADRLSWTLKSSEEQDGNVQACFLRPDGEQVEMNLMSIPVEAPSVHSGQLVGLRLISKPDTGRGVCVILCTESGGCMRLEGGGMADLELHEEVVSIQHASPEMDIARLLGGGHDTTNPLLANAAALAARLLS